MNRVDDLVDLVAMVSRELSKNVVGDVTVVVSVVDSDVVGVFSISTNK